MEKEELARLGNILRFIKVDMKSIGIEPEIVIGSGKPLIEACEILGIPVIATPVCPLGMIYFVTKETADAFSKEILEWA